MPPADEPASIMPSFRSSGEHAEHSDPTMKGRVQVSISVALGQPETITRASVAALLTVDDQDWRAIETGRQVVPRWR